LNRTVNGAFFEGSPCSTAIFAPLGSEGGPSPHLISPAFRKTASSFFAADFDAVSPASAGAPVTKQTTIIADTILIAHLPGT
jgi:hypothetical protein